MSRGCPPFDGYQRRPYRLLPSVDDLDFTIVGVEPVQLGDSTVRGQQKGIRGDGNHIHRIAGATVGFPKRGNASFGRKFPVPIPFPFDPDASRSASAA